MTYYECMLVKYSIAGVEMEDFGNRVKNLKIKIFKILKNL
jgi:hypothetical protein